MFDTNKMTIRFWVRTNCVPKGSVEAPLYCQIRINGVRTSDFSVDISVPISFWDSKSQQVDLSHPLAQPLNTAIMKEKKMLLRLKEEMEEKGKVVNAALLRLKYIDYKKQRMLAAREAAKLERQLPSFLELMDAFIVQKDVKEKRSGSTIKNNKTWRNNWKSFLTKEKQLKIRVHELTAKFGEQFRDSLRSRIKSKSHISNHISLAIKVIDKAIVEGYATSNPFMAIELHYENNFDPEGLEPDQVLQLLTYAHYTEREQQIVDAFLFMASTSMDHCDYINKSWKVEQADGRYWVKYPRQKNAHRSNQPEAEPFILDFGLLIWNKYSKDVSKLPRMSLTEMNRVIKVAARKAGVRFKKLSTKRARKTYANVCSNDLGLSDEAMIYLMGHTSTKHLRAYRKIKRRRVLRELASLDK